MIVRIQHYMDKPMVIVGIIIVNYQILKVYIIYISIILFISINFYI